MVFRHWGQVTQNPKRGWWVLGFEETTEFCVLEGRGRTQNEIL